MPNLLLAEVELSTLASRRLETRESHTLLSGLFQLALRREELVGAVEALFRTATALRSADGPREVGLNGVDRVIDVVAVQAKARLQTKRVAGAETGGQDGCVIKKGLRKELCLVVGHRELEPVLARVTTASEAAALNTGEGSVEPRHEVHLRQVNARRDELRHGGGGARTLQRHQRKIVAVLHRNITTKVGHLLLEPRHVLVFARAVHDHVHTVARVAEHSVINDGALVRSDQREAALAVTEACDVPHEHLLEESHAVGATPANLAHVRHIEKRRLAL
mmetsp:Transcript_34005/g.58397  ORF Transcript_34005/g.58397 Transcript_34005/m.58397 type:complete len:278 (-) Transcript_34005:253-1086(-)